MDMELSGKVALISGASVGIGLAVARALAAEGVNVALLARQEDRLREAAAAIGKEFGVRTSGQTVDVTRAEEIAAAVPRVVAELGGVDILVNNAGTGSAETIMEAPDEKWQYYWDLHVMAAVRLARGLVPGMRRRGGGVILHNASICARQPIDYEPIYNVTKAALAMLSKCMGDDLIRDNIRVNCINPGLILTSAWEEWAVDQTAGTDTTWQAHLDGVAREKAPIGRFATPEELAEFFVFLCSPRASYCVGATYYVDGGWLKVVT
jgi:NAD(P)-dependent dehydrogenase (short-subunit alcohol dehydrogenase family)